MKIDMSADRVLEWIEKNLGWIFVGAIVISAVWGISVAILVARILSKVGIQ